MRAAATLALCLAPLAAASAQFMPQTLPREPVMPGIVDRGTQPRGPSLGSDLADLSSRIGSARANGDLSRREARALRREARQIGRLADRYGEDGLSDSERREIDMRVQALRGLAAAQQGRTN